MAVSDALLPSFSTFASGPAGREKTLRPAGAPNNVSVGPGLWGPPVGLCGWDGDGRSPGSPSTSRRRAGGAPHGLLRRLPGMASSPVAQLYMRVVPTPWSRRGRTPGPHTSRSARAAGRARGPPGGRCLCPQTLAGPEGAWRVGVPVARAPQENLGVPIPGAAGASPGSGGGGTQAGEPRRSLTRNWADTT